MEDPTLLPMFLMRYERELQLVTYLASSVTILSAIATVGIWIWRKIKASTASQSAEDALKDWLWDLMLTLGAFALVTVILVIIGTVASVVAGATSSQEFSAEITVGMLLVTALLTFFVGLFSLYRWESPMPTTGVAAVLIAAIVWTPGIALLAYPTADHHGGGRELVEMAGALLAILVPFAIGRRLARL